MTARTTQADSGDSATGVLIGAGVGIDVDDNDISGFLKGVAVVAGDTPDLFDIYARNRFDDVQHGFTIQVETETGSLLILA